ncbi:phosphoribosylglycinamide formyltransferase [Candidatus Uhrbacteria bacterium]|nr:phosphoribosylglycinamide formyltransferase [Candidatus Uhrbacteria bacterium]
MSSSEEHQPSLIVFASGSKDGGGSGFGQLVAARNRGSLRARIVAVVSNHADGGVRSRAEALGIPFIHFDGPWEAQAYRDLVAKIGAEWVALSGWLKPVRGLDPARTFNIHPGPLPRFGGKGMYGHHVHEAVLAAYRRGEIPHSEVCMHFVTDEYDQGPVFFRHPVGIMSDDTVETLAKRVNATEHAWQAHITNMVIHGRIRWDGRDPASLAVPDGYAFL